MAKYKVPHCHDCMHFRPTVYNSVFDRRFTFRGTALKKYIVETSYKNVHCRMVRRDADNFPHKLGELSNWDPVLLPKHCNHFDPRPLFLVFTTDNNNRNWKFIGAYSTPEKAMIAEYSTMRPRVITSLKDFEIEVNSSKLRDLVNNLPIKIPFADDEISHEMVWSLLQLHNCDSDNFDLLSGLDWLRSIFPKRGDVAGWELMTRYGAYKNVTLRGYLKDLRSPKYAKGKCIDIRPYHRCYIPGDVHRFGTGTNYEEEKRVYGSKLYIRIE